MGFVRRTKGRSALRERPGSILGRSWSQSGRGPWDFLVRRRTAGHAALRVWRASCRPTFLPSPCPLPARKGVLKESEKAGDTPAPPAEAFLCTPQRNSALRGKSRPGVAGLVGGFGRGAGRGSPSDLLDFVRRLPGLVGGFDRGAGRGSPSDLLDFVRRTKGRLAAPEMGNCERFFAGCASCRNDINFDQARAS